MATLTGVRPLSSPSHSMPVAILSLAWRLYVAKLKSDPLLTKAVTSGVLSIVADIAAKKLARRPLKSSSALHELTVGLVLRAPVVHAFHVFLDRVVFARAKNQAAPPIVLGKLALDQILFAPAFLSTYLLLSGALDDVPLAVTKRRIRKELYPMLRSNWCVWVPAQFISYAFVPLNLRVAWGSVVGLFWTTYLISTTSKNTIQPSDNSSATAISRLSPNGRESAIS
jgi:Mpv17 / PMP22 family